MREKTKILLATSEINAHGERILISGIDLGSNPNVMMYEDGDYSKPIFPALVTVEDGRLYATCDQLPDRILDLTPSISIRLKAQDTNEMGGGRLDIIRCKLYAILLTGAPNKDPRVRSIREQIKEVVG